MHSTCTVNSSDDLRAAPTPVLLLVYRPTNLKYAVNRHIL